MLRLVEHVRSGLNIHCICNPKKYGVYNSAGMPYYQHTPYRLMGVHAVQDYISLNYYCSQTRGPYNMGHGI